MITVEVVYRGVRVLKIVDRGGYCLVYDVIQLLKGEPDWKHDYMVKRDTEDLWLDHKVWDGDTIQIRGKGG